MSYNNWESGKTKPNQKNLAELAVLFGVDPAFFESEYQIVSNYLKLNPVNQGKADQYVEELLDTQREEEKKRKLSLFLVLRFTLTLPYPQDQVQPFLMNTKLKRFILRKNGMALTLLLG